MEHHNNTLSAAVDEQDFAREDEYIDRDEAYFAAQYKNKSSGQARTFNM